jgi:predicted DNA-binding antitoxin AbrB/MazE fold protein
MVRTIKAKYSKGVFEPLETVVAEMVSEGEEVLITISTISAVSGDPLKETSGGWKGLIDTEALKQNIYADRLIATRPEVRL